MDAKAKFYKNAEKVLIFIHISRYRYVHIDEIKHEFKLFNTADELVQIINYLTRSKFIHLIEFDKAHYVNSIDSLETSVIIKITPIGIKSLLLT